jgi:hypothetical protein
MNELSETIKMAKGEDIQVKGTKPLVMKNAMKIKLP